MEEPNAKPETKKNRVRKSHDSQVRGPCRKDGILEEAHLGVSPMYRDAGAIQTPAKGLMHWPKKHSIVVTRERQDLRMSRRWKELFKTALI